MSECNAIIEANNEIDRLKRENEKLNELCVEYGFKIGRLEEDNEQLQERNDRQRKRLDELSQLILNRDYDGQEAWIKDLEECEQLLQYESKLYCE